MVNCLTQERLSDIFGISFEEMDKILVEYGLKDGKFATQKALDGKYAFILEQWSSDPLYYWNPIRLSELIRRGIKMDYYIQEVLDHFHNAEDFRDDWGLYLSMVSHAYDEIPEPLRKVVAKYIDRKLIGDRRRACEKCKRKTFFREKDFCWRCLPDDQFKQKRIDLEAKAREAADQVAATGWGTLYKDNSLGPKHSDLDLWNGAVEHAIDAFLTNLINPSKFNEQVSIEIFDCCTDNRKFCELVYSGYDDRDWTRCRAFFNLAYMTVKGVFLQEADEKKNVST